MFEKTKLGNSVNERSGAIPGPAVPWLTVLSLAVVMAYADGFWMMTLRGAVGAIERTQEPFASWLLESTLVLPVFVVAVLGALALALRLFGPVLRPSSTVLAALLVVAAGTVVGIAEIAVSSAYDYDLQSRQLQLMDSMSHTCAKSCLALQQQASLGLQVHAVAYGSGILLVTNLVLVGWAVAIRGGRLDIGRTRRRTARGGQIDHRRLFLATALFGSAAIHAAVVPEHLSEWAAAGAFFIILTAAQLALGLLSLGRRHGTMLLAAAAVSIVPLALWIYSRTTGLPFGPAAGVPEPAGLPDWAAGVLELTSLVAAVVLLRDNGRPPRRLPASAHVRSLTVVAAIAVTVLGLAGTGPAGFDDAGSPADGSVDISRH
ncbi:hypothetical protein GU243_16155 [Pseudarthrobacter psychrotolerans]|uniref:Uncharacterized protein n=1 Tax=Pseudarthrobacter psychrotolerans TaxID=2697569 RepID=A0A6P1NRH2_9MICC|nr:hypothetical protein [Pseudarthrobacter psychrotolerans]QHK20990.1 hypothetical protein GU243_16155 [Pseudarthrobacter psychrotolerans]